MFCQTYALKRYWRPIRTDSNDPALYPSEGQIYNILDKDQTDELMKHAIAYHDVEIDGQVDSTLKLIRRGQVAQPYNRPTKPLRVIRTETDADAEPRLETRDVVKESLPDPSSLVIVERYHTNVLMPMGEVIKMFSCTLELLTCVRDYIKEQKYGHGKLILHRDISTGNLLIFEADDGSTFGRLMDYDHAKKASAMGKIESQIAGVAPSELDVQRDLLRPVIKYQTGRQVEDDVIDVALKWTEFGDAALAYIKDVIKSTGSSDKASDKPLSLTDLGWIDTDQTQPHDWPDFGNREPSPGERTGTVPYMSAEVIARRSLFPLSGNSTIPPFMHQAIHDVESLLWVLVRLCLTRKGPGVNMRRDELDEDSLMYDHQLKEVVNCLFEGSDVEVKDNKVKLVQNSDLAVFEKRVVVHFHPYFEPLKPYVRQWWATLLLGYRHRGEEFYNIHDHILRILDKAIIEISRDTVEDDKAKQAELDRRRLHKERRLATFRPRDLTTPPSSPLSLINTPPHRHRSYQDDQDSPLAAEPRRKKLHQ
ncbi:hypothetical protein C0993_009576 [Termitomyces sp. T159_Od127]|nr:hypothetical protein C0993_009576 [Termitomyces sp. T159_Od127]